MVFLGTYKPVLWAVLPGVAQISFVDKARGCLRTIQETDNVLRTSTVVLRYGMVELKTTRRVEVGAVCMITTAYVHSYEYRVDIVRVYEYRVDIV